ncbi:MAG: hypothetical protein ACJA1A_001314 [Saprospiraceae bacterium]|jgi:hypothetical protein|tara:strand:- start:837 stop:1127 length:291 start_codon:yes stop_codon:yes gene_type:complete
MSGSGTTISMIRSIESNAKLLNRTNMFAQIKSINNRSGHKYTYIPMSKEALASLRADERNQIKSNLLKSRIIGVLVMVPCSFVILAGIYILINALI